MRQRSRMAQKEGKTGDGLEARSIEKPPQWKFTQWFRKMQNAANRQEEGEDYDHLTAVQFDDTGRFLATGEQIYVFLRFIFFV